MITETTVFQRACGVLKEHLGNSYHIYASSTTGEFGVNRGVIEDVVVKDGRLFVQLKDRKVPEGFTLDSIGDIEVTEKGLYEHHHIIKIIYKDGSYFNIFLNLN